MRGFDTISRALLFVACARHAPQCSPTLAELGTWAGVGAGVARTRVHALRRADHIAIARERRVPYRNRPVAEYAPAAAVAG